MNPTFFTRVLWPHDINHVKSSNNPIKATVYADLCICWFFPKCSVTVVIRISEDRKLKFDWLSFNNKEPRF